MRDQSSDQEEKFQRLLQQARSGLREAFDELVKPYWRALRIRARRRMERRLQSKIGDSDFVQITCLKAFENLSEFQGSTEKEFAAWLFGILEHVACDAHRAWHTQARDVSREVPIEIMKKWELIIDPRREEEDDRLQRLRTAWRRLPADNQLVLQWRFYEGRSYDEIADWIGRTRIAVKHLCYRAVGKLYDEARSDKTNDVRETNERQ